MHIKDEGRFLLLPSSTAMPTDPTVLAESSMCWQGVQLSLVREDIARPKEWQVHRDRHTVIVHRSGFMSELDTQIDGVSARHGVAKTGDTWAFPAGLHYLAAGAAAKSNMRYCASSPLD